jgi:hypothetical protein
MEEAKTDQGASGRLGRILNPLSLVHRSERGSGLERIDAVKKRTFSIRT